MKMNAMPGCGGRERNKLLKASSPPAEAPMATIGKLVRVVVTEDDVTPRRCWRLAFFFFGGRGMSSFPEVADSIETLGEAVN